MLILDLGFVTEAIRTLMAWLCSFIYRIIASLFELFINISKVQLLSSDEIQPIYQRVTLALTIVMIFYVMFEAVKYIVEPDTFSDKEKGASKVVVRMIIVVGLIAFVPKIFTFAFKVQNTLIEKEVLSKVILGKSNTSAATFGSNFSADVLSLFYYYNKDYWDGEDKDCGSISCEILVIGNIDTLRATGQLENLSYGINESAEKTERGVSAEVPLITFDGLWAVVVGAILVYVLVLYCIDLGVRVAQLAFLQIIAPIPIIGYLSPKKENIFTKWLKQCMTTYFDLFLRLAIIYFVLLVCEILGTAYNNGTLLQGVSDDSSMLLYIAIILGLLLFAQKAPKMLQELFPKMGAASGNFGLKQKDRLSAISRAAGAVFGATRMLGGAYSRARNARKRNKRLEEETGKNRKERKADAKDARAERDRARRAYRNARRSGKTGEDLKKARDEMVSAESKYADAMNKRNRSVVGNAAAGALRGAWTGARTGFGAKEIKDIRKKIKEGTEKDKQHIVNYEQWLNSGGYSQTQRLASKFEQKVGVTTDAGRTESTIKYYDNKSKMHETLSKLEADTKAKRDAVETRLDSKIEKGELNKVKLITKTSNKGGTTIEGMEDVDLDIQTGDTASSLYARYRAKTETAKLALDAATKTGDPVKIAAAEKAYGEAQDQEKAVRKYAMRNTLVQALRNPTQTGTDPVAVEAIKTMKTSIAIAKSNYPVMKDYALSLVAADTTLSATEKEKLQKSISECPNRDSLESIISSSPLSGGLKSEWGHLINEDYDSMSYDDLDHIVSRFQDSSNENQRQASEFSETKRKYETSDQYASEKANDTSGKPSGK